MTFVSEVTADSPVLWARLAETRGTSAADATGGAAGTYVGSPTLNQGSLLNAALGDRGIALDGRAQYVTFPDDSRTDRGDVITIVAFVIFTAYRDSAGAPAVIVDKGTNAYVFRMSNAMDGTLLFRRNGVADLCTSTTRLALNTLYMVVARKNGATSSIRVNKVNVTRAGTNSTMTNNSNVFSIGVADVTAGPANGFFPGRIDEIIIFSTSLSDARVDAYYDAAFNVPASVTATGGGTVTSTTRKGARGTASATGGGTVAGTGRKAASGTVRATGGGASTGLGRKGASGTANVTGGGTLTLRGGRSIFASTTISGDEGDVSGAGSKGARGGCSITNTMGSVTGTGLKSAFGSTTVTGGGGLTASATLVVRDVSAPPSFLTIHPVRSSLTVNTAPTRLALTGGSSLSLDPYPSELTVDG